MTPALEDLLNRMREHPAFPELLKAVEPPEARDYRESQDAGKQQSDWIFRSGRRVQQRLWTQFLTEGEASQQENP